MKNIKAITILDCSCFICSLIFFIFFTNDTFFAAFRISLDSIFAGMLALAGFIFTARTFIVFKLNESFYGNSSYREMIKELKRDGAYDKELYGPLKNLDNMLHKSTFMCVAGVIVFFGCTIVYSFFDSTPVCSLKSCSITILEIYNQGITQYFNVNMGFLFGKIIISRP